MNYVNYGNYDNSGKFYELCKSQQSQNLKVKF